MAATVNVTYIGYGNDWISDGWKLIIQCSFLDLPVQLWCCGTKYVWHQTGGFKCDIELLYL